MVKFLDLKNQYYSIKEEIDNAIKKVIAGADNSNYEEMRYEGYSPGGVAIIVEGLTDNRNRTASEVRSIFTKMGGALGETGSVNFMFDKLGIIQFANNIANQDDFFEVAIDFGADDVIFEGDLYIAITQVENFIQVRDNLIKKYGDALSAQIS